MKVLDVRLSRLTAVGVVLLIGAVLAAILA